MTSRLAVAKNQYGGGWNGNLKGNIWQMITLWSLFKWHTSDTYNRTVTLTLSGKCPVSCLRLESVYDAFPLTSVRPNYAQVPPVKIRTPRDSAYTRRAKV